MHNQFINDGILNHVPKKNAKLLFKGVVNNWNDYSLEEKNRYSELLVGKYNKELLILSLDNSCIRNLIKECLTSDID